jgi:hypothetical protein
VGGNEERRAEFRVRKAAKDKTQGNNGKGIFRERKQRSLSLVSLVPHQMAWKVDETEEALNDGGENDSAN